MIPITEKRIICQTHGVPDCIECSVPPHRCPVEGCLLTNPHTGKHAFRRSYHKDECQFNYDGKTCDGGCEPYPPFKAGSLEWEIVLYADQIARYYRDPAWAEEQEVKATEATDGNVTAIEAIAQSLKIRLERMLNVAEVR